MRDGSCATVQGEYCSAHFADRCGDSFVNTGEDCDPGAPTAGCGADCRYLAPLAAAESCPGMVPLASVPAGATVLRSEDLGLTTYGHADGPIGSCALAGGGGDVAIQLLPAVTGTMRVRVGYDDGIAGGDETLVVDDRLFDPFGWDVQLHAR